MKIYYNGTILTMEDNKAAEAVCVDGGRIAAAGDLKYLLEKYPGAEKEDLKGHTMLPGFIDPHSHFSAAANALLQVPLEDAHTGEEIGDKIRVFLEKNNLKAGDWVMARGYDHNQMREKRHLSLEELDEICPLNPLVIQHKSGHMGLFNSKALELLGVTAETPSPEGGRIEKKDGRLTGYMEENAFLYYLQKTPAPGMKALASAFRQVQEKYASYGITTVQEGMMVDRLLPLYQYLIQSEGLELDVVGYPSLEAAPDFMKAFPQALKKYFRHFKIGGYKIFLDGSPQGRTAWMQEPYRQVSGEDEKDYCGYGTMKDEEVLAAVKKAVREGLQLLAHCNGDAAAEQYIRAVGKAEEEGEPVKEIRPVMVHAQLLRRDQMVRVKKFGIIPSFFVAHVYHWGEVHVKNFGLGRASAISPAGSALKEGILFTFHQDTPVIEPDMMETVWCAVQRETKEGRVLGAEERIPVEEALKAVTINAARQYGEEAEKGSIRPGKQADLVILDQNPLDADPGQLRGISVLETIKGGKTIYRKE